MKTALLSSGPRKFLHLLVFAVLAVSLAAFLPSQQAAQAAPTAVGTPHSGNTLPGEHWTVDGNPHIVTAALTVPAGLTLTIDPGVIVQISQGITIRVLGTMNADASGSPEQITFTSVLGQSNFGQIWFVGTGSAGNLRNCEISNGGATVSEVIRTETGNLTVASCSLHNNSSQRVIRIAGGNGVAPTFSDLDITDNTNSIAVYQDNVNAKPHYSDLRFTNNGTDALVIDTNFTVISGSSITLDGSLATFNGAPIYFPQGLTVATSGALTLTPGTTLQLGGGTNLEIQSNTLGGTFGTFTAIGTAENPITITKRDTNNFGSVIFRTLSNVNINHATISYGGSGQTQAVLIASNAVTLEDVNIQDNQANFQAVTIGYNGASGSAGMTPTLRRVNVLRNNGVAIVQLSANMTPVYDDVTLTGNTGADAVDIGSAVTTNSIDRNIVLDNLDINGAPFYAGSLTIDATFKVMVTANTRLHFKPYSVVLVNGTFQALGTTAEHVTITSVPGADNWGRFDFSGTSAALFQYADISNGGKLTATSYSPQLITISSSGVSIKRSTISNNLPAQQVILMNGIGISPTIQNTVIQNNTGYAIVQNNINQYPNFLNVTFSDNTLASLDSDVLVIGTGSTVPSVLGGNLVTIDGPAINDSPVYLLNGAIVAPTAVLTITAGTDVQMGAGRTLLVREDARLMADGTDTAKITFTARTTNFGRIDISATALAEATGSLSNCQISQGGTGSGISEPVRILSSSFTMHDCEIFDNGSETTPNAQAVMVGSGSILNLTTQLSNLSIHDNQGYGISQGSAKQDITYDNILFTDTAGDQINGVYLGTGVINANITLDVNDINGSPFYARAITVPSGFTLALTPGTNLRLLPTSVLLVQTGGTFNAVGTSTDPVRILSNLDAPLPVDHWTSIDVATGGTANFGFCEIRDGGNTTNYMLRVVSANITLNNCDIHDNGYSANSQIVTLSGATTTPEMRNLVLRDNTGTGMLVSAGAKVTLRHATFARISATGLQVTGSGSNMVLSNSIIADIPLGVRADSSGNADLYRTLWDGVTKETETATSGTINTYDSDRGAIEFAWDGYHLTRYSFAIGKSLSYGRPEFDITDDIDGQTRPSPVGTVSDVGADEYVYNFGEDPAAEKGAYAPKWVVAADPVSGNPTSYLQQDYLLRFFQGLAGHEALIANITDTLPADLSFGGESHYPEMLFQDNGSTLNWQTAELVPEGDTSLLAFSGIGLPANGTTLLNEGELQSGSLNLPFGATSLVPVFEPLVASPAAGPTCAGTVNVRGAAQPGATVNIFDTATVTPTLVVTADAAGIFSADYTYTSGNKAITATACFGTSCSTPSDPVFISLKNPCTAVTEPAEATAGAVVYDITQGLAFPVDGITVTAMVSRTEWGGWVPWPGVLYGVQNPIVTGADGTYTFRVPNGLYYIQVEGKAGYQSWRSAEINVTTHVLQVNVPLTPKAGVVPAAEVMVSASGLSLPVVQIDRYQAVQWVGAIDPNIRMALLMDDVANPTARLISSVLNTDGWDSGMLSPGMTFQRKFNKVGTYTYTDGFGHTGTVQVLEEPVTGLAAGNNGPTDLGSPTSLTSSITAGANVVFTWDFGDGTTDVTGQNVNHTYAAVGDYTATVSATNTRGTVTATTLVTVRDVTIAGLAASNNGPTNKGQPTTLTASVTAGTNVVYTWSFGDSTTGTGASVQHTYATTGDFTATVTAVNGRGSATAQTVVTVEDPVIAGLEASNDGPTTVGQATTLSATVDDATGTTFSWNFGDGSPAAAGQSVQHTYAAVGSYTATVTAHNSIGEDTATTLVSVIDVAISGFSAQSSSPTTVNATTYFTATSTAGTGVVYTWDFGDGTATVTGAQVTHVYAQEGDYTVTVTASNTAGSVTPIELTVVVKKGTRFIYLPMIKRTK